MRCIAWMAMLLCWPGMAIAGAWTADAGRGQLIATILYSHAARSFNSGGHAVIPDRSDRIVLQTYTEYGWDEGVTLFLQTDSVHADTISGSGSDNGVGAGARLRLWRDDNSVLSVELGARAAGAYNFSISDHGGQSGSAAELRLLYGRGFTWRGMNGFAGAEIGQRFVSAPRPSETPIDLTAGLWLDPDWMVMAQSFNVIAQGGAPSPYGYFRAHKLQLSAVHRLSDRFLVQAGFFISPSGRNALQEQGLCLSLWTRF